MHKKQKRVPRGTSTIKFLWHKEINRTIKRTSCICIYNNMKFFKLITLMQVRKVKIKKYITSSRIFSARRSILNILPTTWAKLLCHSMSCFLSNSIPSSMSMVEILAASKHVELMDCNPESLRYSSTPHKDNWDPYYSAICLRFLCHIQSNAVRREAQKWFLLCTQFPKLSHLTQFPLL